MTSRQLSRREEWLHLQHEADVEDWVDKNSPMCGCESCSRDFQGFAEDRQCPGCGGPLQNYDRQTMREIAEEYV